MERDPQKLSAVLADPTRYAIYQYVLNTSRPVLVQEIAKSYDLHPNVARMHLSKLTEIGLLAMETSKTGRGGRPGYVYTPSGNMVSLSVSARDFQLLAELLVQSLAMLGDGSRTAIAEVGRSFGIRLGREALASLGHQPAGLAESLQVCAAAVRRLGVAITVTQSGDGVAHLALKSCGFREVATAHPEYVCHLCKAMVRGITEVCMENAPSLSVESVASIPSGDSECVYELHGLIHLK